MKGAKDTSIVNNISRDIIENLEEIDEVTIDEEEQAVPESRNSSKCMYFMSFGPLIRVFVRTIYCRSWSVLKNPLSEAVKAPIAAKEELFDVEEDVIDGHPQFQDEGVARLFVEDDKELLVEVIKEELKVRATVPDVTIVI